MTETLNFAKSSGGGDGKLDMGASDCAEEVANEVEMAGVEMGPWPEAAANAGEAENETGYERSTTPTPMPARWCNGKVGLGSR